MPLIYEPKGKAREYSPLALNIYTGGCEHECTYCYCKNITAWGKTPKVRSLAGLEKEAAKVREQVLLSFMSDPYALIESTARNTRKALDILRSAECSVAILTKGGTRCLQDLDLFRNWPSARIKVGATLTFISDEPSLEHEPGAALPKDRIEALRRLHEAGVRTWASIEPVIDPVESLAVIEASLPYTDAYKVGKLNHKASSTNWTAFAYHAINMIRDAGKALYVKEDLRKHVPPSSIRTEEADMNGLNLPPRPW